MRSTRLALERLRAGLDKVSLTVASLLLILIAGVVVWGVFCRYVLFAPLPWSEQIPKYAMVWMAFLGASVGISRNSHVAFDILISLLPSQPRKLVALAGHLLVLIFLVMLTIYGTRLALAVGFSANAPMLPVPMFYFLIAVPVGGALMIAQLVIRVLLEIWTAEPEEAGLRRTL